MSQKKVTVFYLVLYVLEFALYYIVVQDDSRGAEGTTKNSFLWDTLYYTEVESRRETGRWRLSHFPGEKKGPSGGMSQLV